jgi:PAS domain S-box-containing protein
VTTVGPRVDAGLLLRLEHAVDDLLASHREPERALPGIVATIGTTLGWPFASVWMWREGGLRQVADWSVEDGPDAERFAQFREQSASFVFGAGEGLPGKVWEANRALWIVDVDDPQQFPRAVIAQRIGLRSALGFPIGDAHDSAPEGVIELFTDIRLDPDRSLLATLASLGHRLGSHIARARDAALARHGEALFRATVESALDAVVVVGADGLIVEFNPSATEIFGWSRAEAVGRDLPELIVPPGLRSQHRHAWTRHLETGHRSILGTRIETIGLRRDGVEFPVELTITEAMVDGQPTFTGHLRDLTASKEAEAELLASRRRVVSAGDEARRLIERNLHDGAQQRMVSLALLLGRARSALPDDPTHATELLDQAVSEISETADELRRLARGIHPAGLTRYGLAAALADLARRSGPDVSVGPLPDGRFDETVEVTAYYVAAEAVTNALRHAVGAQVEISGAVEGGALVLRVADDGPGGVGAEHPLGSSGLSGLRDRVVAVGGTLQITSATGSGTEVVGRLPLAEPTS